MRQAFAGAVLALWASLAMAAMPVKVTADNFVVDEVKKQATFTGNVLVDREGLQLSADQVVVD